MTRKLLMFAAASTCMLATATVQAQLVVNGDFTYIPPGNTLPYTLPTSHDSAVGWYNPNASGSPNGSVTIISGTDENGHSAAQLAHITGGTDAYLRQDIQGLVPGTYRLSFSAKEEFFPSASLYVTLFTELNGSDLSFDEPNVWKEFTYDYKYVDTSSTSPIYFFGDSGTYDIADVSLTAVPEPSTWVAGVLLLLPIGMSTLRKLRKTQLA